MPRLRAALMLPIIAAALAAHCSSHELPLPSSVPTSPTPTPVVAMELTVTGPTQLAPGATGQYTATVRNSDGSVTDVSADAEWRATTVPAFLSIGPGGSATALTTGWGDVSASYGTLRRYYRVIVAEDNIFQFVGVVRDKDTGQPIPWVRINAEDARGVRQGTYTDVGDVDYPFILFLARGPATLRMALDGYVTKTEIIEITKHEGREFTLERQKD